MTLRKEKEAVLTSTNRPMADGQTPKAGAISPHHAASPSLTGRLIALHHAGQVTSISPASNTSAGAGRSTSPNPSSSSKGGAKSPDGLSLAELEALEKKIFKFHLVLQDACPPGVPAEKVEGLALGGMGLNWVDFHPFTGLTKLLLSRNALTSIAYSGIETLKHLIVLDAHHNRLTDLGEVISICNELPQLEYISFIGNKFTVFDHGVAEKSIKTSESLAQAEMLSPAGGLGPNGLPLIQQQVISPTAQHASSSSILGHHSVYSPEKYRLTFIGHLQQLQSASRRLRFLDGLPISEDEVIRGLKELGHSHVDREMFRWHFVVAAHNSHPNSITFGKDGSNPECKSLDVADRKLQRGDFTRFPHLTYLNLSKNNFDDQSLLESHLPRLQELIELNVSENNIKSMSHFARMINVMPKLRILRINRNPGYSKGDSERARRHMLASFENIHMTSFQLEYLNGKKITIDERMEAMVHARNHWNQLHGAGQPHRHSLLQYPNSAAAGGAAGANGANGAIVVSPKSPDEEQKSPQHAMTPPPNVGNGPNPPAAADGAVSGANFGRDNPSALTPAMILKQGGMPVDLEGDIHTQVENARFILTVHEMHMAGNATEAHLRKKGLKLLGGHTLGIASFECLQVVDLRENHLVDLKDSGIDLLPKMHTLDIRANDFVSLESIIVSLRGCNALQYLHLQFATKSHDETNVPSSYVERVFSDLRGLKMCDDLISKVSVTKLPCSIDL
jgi:Leucine-rich repeat (LRR) protein